MKLDESESRDFFRAREHVEPKAPCFRDDVRGDPLVHGLEPARWHVWSRMPTSEVWEAAMLSLDIEPPLWVDDPRLNRTLDIHPRLPDEFYDRLKICRSSIYEGGPISPVASQGASMRDSPRCRVMLRDVAVLLPTAGFRVAEGMQSLALTSTEKTADATLPDAEAAQRVKRGALIANNQRRWPDIEKHLNHGAENGLSQAAKLPERGWWHEGRAQEWARQHGHLKHAG